MAADLAGHRLATWRPAQVLTDAAQQGAAEAKVREASQAIARLVKS